MQKIKIVLFCSIPIELNKTSGGVESVCINLLSGFRNLAEAELLVISFSKQVKEKVRVSYSHNINLCYFPYKYPQSELLDYFFNRKDLKTSISSFSPDIIHIQGAAPFLLRFIGYPRRNIVVTQHGIVAEELKRVTGMKKKAKFLFKFWVERFYFPRFSNFVFISRYNFSLFPNRSFRHHAFIANPVNEEFFNDSIPALDSNRLIYVGWISALKNILALLQALKTLREKEVKYSLIVIGAFREQRYRQEVESFIEQNRMQRQITFTGVLDQERVNEELRKSAIFVLPSLQENLPVSIAEAMATGNIVVASDVGAVSEMFIDGESGFLFRDKEGLVAVLEKLSKSDLNQKNSISSKVKFLARERYHPLTVAQKTLDFYKEIIAR